MQLLENQAIFQGLAAGVFPVGSVSVLRLSME